jgi:hypothetical protein
VKDELIEFVLFAIIFYSSLDLLLRETIQYLIVLLGQLELAFQQVFLFSLDFLIAEEDLHSLLFVDEECQLAMKADEGEAEITGNLFNRLDFVVHFGILVN